MVTRIIVVVILVLLWRDRVKRQQRFFFYISTTFSKEVYGQEVKKQHNTPHGHLVRKKAFNNHHSSVLFALPPRHNFTLQGFTHTVCNLFYKPLFHTHHSCAFDAWFYGHQPRFGQVQAEAKVGERSKLKRVGFGIGCWLPCDRRV